MMAELPSGILGKMKFVNARNRTAGNLMACDCPRGCVLEKLAELCVRVCARVFTCVARTQPSPPPLSCAHRGSFRVQDPWIPALGGPAAPRLAFLLGGWGARPPLGSRSVNRPVVMFWK